MLSNYPAGVDDSDFEDGPEMSEDESLDLECRFRFAVAAALSDAWWGVEMTKTDAPLAEALYRHYRDQLDDARVFAHKHGRPCDLPDCNRFREHREVA